MGQKVSTVNPMLGIAGGTNRKRSGGEWFSHKVITTTSGTVDTTNSDQITESRMSVAKTAATTGRYTITLPDKYRKFLGGFVTVLGPNTANYGANTTGLDVIFRANDVDGNNNDGTLELQFVQASYADAEIPDGTSFIVTLLCARGI